MKTSPLLSRSGLWLLLSVVSAISMAHYVATIWSANQSPHFSDLYAPWWAAHELLLRGRNPYAPAVAHEIQTAIYGAPVPSSPNDPAAIAGGFAYPPYVTLLLWPTIHTSFPAAQWVFLSMSLLLTLLSLALWFSAFRWRPPPIKCLAVAIFVLGSFPALEAFKLENLSLIAAGFVAITLFFLSGDHPIVAGIFLAASTFKPQFVVTLVPWLAIWTAVDWHRRRPMAWSFLATLLSLGLVSEWLVPGWIPSFLKVVRAYRHYTYGRSLLDVWFSPSIGTIVAGGLVVAAVALCWRYRSFPGNSPRFLLVTSFMLAANVVIIPTLAPHAQLLLLPAFLCLLSNPVSTRTANLFTRLSRGAVWILLAWPWVAAFGLLLASFAYPTAVLLRFWQVPLYTSPLLPLGTLLALGGLLLGGGGLDRVAEP